MGLRKNALRDLQKHDRGLKEQNANTSDTINTVLDDYDTESDEESEAEAAVESVVVTDAAPVAHEPSLDEIISAAKEKIVQWIDLMVLQELMQDALGGQAGVYRVADADNALKDIAHAALEALSRAWSDMPKDQQDKHLRDRNMLQVAYRALHAIEQVRDIENLSDEELSALASSIEPLLKDLSDLALDDAPLQQTEVVQDEYPALPGTIPSIELLLHQYYTRGMQIVKDGEAELFGLIHELQAENMLSLHNLLLQNGIVGEVRSMYFARLNGVTDAIDRAARDSIERLFAFADSAFGDDEESIDPAQDQAPTPAPTPETAAFFGVDVETNAANNDAHASRTSDVIEQPLLNVEHTSSVDENSNNTPKPSGGAKRPTSLYSQYASEQKNATVEKQPQQSGVIGMGADGNGDDESHWNMVEAAVATVEDEVRYEMMQAAAAQAAAGYTVHLNVIDAYDHTTALSFTVYGDVARAWAARYEAQQARGLIHVTNEVLEALEPEANIFAQDDRATLNNLADTLLMLQGNVLGERIDGMLHGSFVAPTDEIAELQEEQRAVLNQVRGNGDESIPDWYGFSC